MSAQFKCKRSGRVLVFLQEHDILTMRKEPGYEEITQSDASLRAEPNTVAKVSAKQRGRPKKGQ